MSITVSGLTKIYDDQKAVDDISFTVKRGEVVGFLGPNGAGKSTTMKIITCFIPQSFGVVTVCGHDVTKDSISVRKSVGYLSEHNPLYGEMYVKEYLEFVARVHQISKMSQRIAELVQMTGLEAEQHKKVGQLSKGYKQRVGLAQAMMHDPEVLILDEPTSGLDPNQLIEIRQLIKQLGKEKTVVLSTHIMQEVQAVCDRVIIINKGSIVADEDTDVLQNMAVGERMVKVEFAEPVNPAQLENLPGVARIAQGPHGEWQLFSTDSIDIRPTIFEFAKNGGYTLLTLQQEKQSLEDVFRKLTRN